jgi:DNA polymerase III gamma/tau subunit
MSGLYQKHRPKAFNEVVGQEKAVAQMQKFLARDQFPHALMFVGPSGCGKTTMARITKDELGCGDRDFVEINAADFKGVDTIRDIRRQMQLSPLFGSCRVWLIDEAQKLTGDAQGAILKMLEDTPRHVYFMLCTTDPQKLLKTIHTRCTVIKLEHLDRSKVIDLIFAVAAKEKMKLADDVTNAIAEAAEGSARKALVILEQVGWLPVDEQLENVEAVSQDKDQAILLARELIKPGCKWQDVAAILKELKDEPETIRYMVLGYARAVLLGGGPLAKRAFLMIDCFGRNFYDSKQAGLAAACWEVVHAA